MKGVSHIRGVADVRTAVSTHYRNTSRQKGTPYLEIMSLGMERLRLEMEQELLSKRNARINLRLAEINGLMDTRLKHVQGETDASQASIPEVPEQTPQPKGTWRTMKVDY